MYNRLGVARDAQRYKASSILKLSKVSNKSLKRNDLLEISPTFVFLSWVYLFKIGAFFSLDSTYSRREVK